MVDDSLDGLKYEKQEIHKKRIAGKTVLLVSRWTVRHVTNPKRITRLADKVRLFVGVRYRRILRRKV